MTDRELLELAAKAAGYDDAKYQDLSGWGEVRYGLSEAIYSNKLYDEFGTGYWNPLEDDGQALRLAVKLLLRIEHDAAYQQNQDSNTKVRVLAEHQQLIVGHGEQGQWQKEWHETDPYAATRRAIVRAAAAIGETL